MPQFSYTPHGVCCSQITFELKDDGRVYNINFIRGCSGNTQGVARLAEGRPADEVIKLLERTDCNMRGTSCPDQLAQALKLGLEEIKKSNQ